MQAIRFGELFKSLDRDTAQRKLEQLHYQRKKPVMTDVQMRPDGIRVWFIATELDRLQIEGLIAFNGGIDDAYRALDRQIAREEKGASTPGPRNRSQLYEKYRDLVENYLENNEAFRLRAQETLKLLRKAINLDAGQEMDVR